ncbi:uncharacterized protein B0I36DRAFT_323099 [Microdochium trichocladiopsis]|uniref:Uncharacterized protein n=1 Tax=Microdochium trichocladiopsis TaxID=1682393 RepID=A0A9P8Y7C3_9PEZI|nr:uncharacterized protein B0I36DRAFT_323099 [Microdochium trichocladiopsis]KAH7031058.1 hypothetical protein B0I36DRAFT_323099 [Microdochium trichocladiopsis]
MIELYVHRLERLYFLQLERTLRSRKFGQPSRTDLSASVRIYLRVLELDCWRLMFWLKHPRGDYRWRHPKPAMTLLEREIFMSPGFSGRSWGG